MPVDFIWQTAIVGRPSPPVHAAKPMPALGLDNGITVHARPKTRAEPDVQHVSITERRSCPFEHACIRNCGDVQAIPKLPLWRDDDGQHTLGPTLLDGFNGGDAPGGQSVDLSVLVPNRPRKGCPETHGEGERLLADDNWEPRTREAEGHARTQVASSTDQYREIPEEGSRYRSLTG